MKIPLINLVRQYEDIKKETLERTHRVLAQGNFILGKELDEFENAFAKYLRVRFCIGVASGTDALLLSLKALGVGSEDEVITAANTYIATILPVIYLGAKPTLVDINHDTYQLDTKKVKEAITKKTKVIIPVHLYGIPAPMEEIMRIAKTYNLFVLEDACQAHGSSINGRFCGSFGDISAFSFYPGKNLGAAGDGGAIVTNKKKLAEKIRALRDFGQTEKYKHNIIGHNSRLDTLHATILYVKLKKLESWNRRRNKFASLYRKLLKDIPVMLPPEPSDGIVTNYHLFVIRTKKRDKLLEFLRGHNIFCGIHYPIPIHLQKSMKGLGYQKGDFPITEKYAKEILSLPMNPHLTGKEVEFVCSTIERFLVMKR